MFFNILVNGVIQVLIFSVIPFIWWLFTARKENFFYWLGLKKYECSNKNRLVISILTVLIVNIMAASLINWIIGENSSAFSQFDGKGIAAVPEILAFAFIQTGLSEEILFRGFLMKRLMAKFGFVLAATIQAIVFGAFHLLLAWGQVGAVEGILIAVYPILPALGIAYVNEKIAGGSILPGWIIHSVLNVLSAIFRIL